MSITNQQVRKGRCTAERIFFLLRLADASITLFPRSWFKTGISKGNGPWGRGLVPAGGPFASGSSPCWSAAASYVDGATFGSSDASRSRVADMTTSVVV